MWYDLQSFYKSKEWTQLIATIKFERANGDIICEHCGKPIIKAYDCIGHHKEPLTIGNVNDISISLNPSNIALVHHKCHNIIHKRFGNYQRHIYLVYGCPFAGKSEWVKENAEEHDLIISLDRIYECIGINPAYIKSGRLSDNAFAVRNILLDAVKTRRGKWVSCYIVGGYPYSGERERLCNELGAEPILIECDKETALQRLASAEYAIDKKQYTEYIEQWFNRYTP